MGGWKRGTRMDTRGVRGRSPRVPGPAVGPALSQCCIRALGGRTRSAGPSPLARGANPPAPAPCRAAFCRETLGGRRGGARPVCAPPPGSLGKGRDLPVPASGATRPGAVARGSGRAPVSRRRGAWRSSEGSGARAPAFSRLNFLFPRWEREGAATPSPDLLARPCGEAPRLRRRGERGSGQCVFVSLGALRPLWMPRGGRGGEKTGSGEPQPRSSRAGDLVPRDQRLDDARGPPAGVQLCAERPLPQPRRPGRADGRRRPAPGAVLCSGWSTEPHPEQRCLRPAFKAVPLRRLRP